MLVKCVLLLLSLGRSSRSGRSLISVPSEPSHRARPRQFPAIYFIKTWQLQSAAFIAIATRSRSTRLPAPHNFNSPHAPFSLPEAAFRIETPRPAESELLKCVPSLCRMNSKGKEMG